MGKERTEDLGPCHRLILELKFEHKTLENWLKTITPDKLNEIDKEDLPKHLRCYVAIELTDRFFEHYDDLE